MSTAKPRRDRKTLPSAENSGKSQVGTSLLALALLVILSVFAYGNALDKGFAYDDHLVIVENDKIQDMKRIPALFTTGFWLREGSTYRPLPLATFAIDYALGGLEPFGYHLVNLLLHIAVSWLLYALARRLGCSVGAALAASAIFAVHPLHAEAVTGIVGRAELLMSLGVLLALIWYIDGGAPAKLELGYGAASLSAFAAALFSKEQAMMVPFVLLLYDLTAWKPAEPWTDRIKPALARYLFYVVVLIAFLALIDAVTGTAPMSRMQNIKFLDNPLAHQEWPLRFMTALKVSGSYLWLFIWPQFLSADYSYNAISLAKGLLEAGVLASLFAWGALLGLAVWSYRKGSRLAFFAVGFMFLTFLPASNFLIQIGTIMGERLFYLPSAGLCLLVAAAWDGLAAHYHLNVRTGLGKLCIGTIAIIVILLGLRTIDRNRDWENNLSLFTATTQVVPESAKAWANLALAKGKRGDIRGALQDYQRALEIYPEYARRHPYFAQGLGMALAQLGRLDAGLPYLRMAAKGRPDEALLQYNLGFAYLQAGSWSEAEPWLRKAIALDPDYVRPYVALSGGLRRQGQLEDALETADRAIRIDADSVPARFERALTLEALGRFGEAADEYRRVLRMRPDPALERKISELQRSAVGHRKPQEAGRREAEAGDREPAVGDNDPSR